MAILTNPVTVSVIVLCVLSLLKLNVLLAMLVACIVGGLVGGIPIWAEEGDTIMSLLTGGFTGNATTALAYVLLGVFATAIATTGRDPVQEAHPHHRREEAGSAGLHHHHRLPG